MSIRGRIASLKAIVAVGPSAEIGLRSRNELPWRITSEYQHFLGSTAGHRIVVGRATFSSILPPDIAVASALSNWSSVVVISSSFDASTMLNAPACDKVRVVRSLGDVLAMCEAQPDVPTWICGGERLYSEALPFISELVITKVAGYVPIAVPAGADDIVRFPLELAEAMFKTQRLVRSVDEGASRYAVWSFTP